jgi:hypothetical protein
LDIILVAQRKRNKGGMRRDREKENATFEAMAFTLLQSSGGFHPPETQLRVVE